jgi:hypothetical protein
MDFISGHKPDDIGAHQFDKVLTLDEISRNPKSATIPSGNKQTIFNMSIGFN